jgi:hypothetical protein
MRGARVARVSGAGSAAVVVVVVSVGAPVLVVVAAVVVVVVAVVGGADVGLIPADVDAHALSTVSPARAARGSRLMLRCRRWGRRS